MKTKMMIAAMTALLLTAGCGEQAAVSDAVPDENDVQHSQETAENQELSDTEESSMDESDSEPAEDRVYEWFGIGMNIPADYTSTGDYKYCVWEGMDTAGNCIYYGYDQFMGYSYDAEEVCPLEDVPDVMEGFVLDLVDEYYPAGTANSVISVETETKTIFLGYDALRRSGVIHAEKFDEVHKLSYAAYYSVINFPEGDYQDVPVVWISFAETMDEDTKQMLGNIVDEAAEKAYYLE